MQVPNRRLALRLALAVVVGIGFLLPAVLYFARPSLLLDEVRLALNIGARSWIGLTRPLDYDQAAPLLFLWAEKLATMLGGVNEYTLRALPFAAAAVLPPLVWLVGRRLVGDGGAVMAAGITAVCPLVLQYARQVKPYTVDAVVGLVLLWLAIGWLEAPEEARRSRWMAVAGMVVPWISIPGVFALAAVLTTAVTVPPPRRPSTRLLLLLATVWGASLALVYLWIYRPAADDPYMQQFWQASLLSIGEPGFFARLWQGIRELFWQTFVGGTTEPGVAPLLDALATPGAAALLTVWLLGVSRAAPGAGRRRWALIFGPVVVALAASCVGKYPIAARTMLFAVPALAIGAAAGWLAVVRGFAPRPRRAVGFLTGACLLGPPLVLDSRLVIHRLAFENVRDAVQEYAYRHAPGESIYVFAAALPAWTFYTTDWRQPDRPRLARMARLGSLGGAAFENAPPRTHAIGMEGDSLSYPLGDAREIIGLYHGAQGRSGAPLAQYAPDTNWTTNEARRIRNAAIPSVWLLTIRTLGLERYLYAATGLCLDRLYERDGFALVRLTATPTCTPHAAKAGR